MSILQVHNCFGCGVCAISCSKQIIKIKFNSEGFYEPLIENPDKCTNCGLCIEVCAYSHGKQLINNQFITSYAVWSNDPAIRRKCSSGGVGFEIGKYIIEQGGKVCGVRFNAEKNQAEHYVASTNQELIPSIGSKYIQSYTVDGFNDIIKQLRQAKKQGENPTYLVIGTPCQIDSLRRYIRKFKIEDNFVLLDFFCHGVPSKLMWDKYVAHVEKQVGKLTYVSWRNKFTGWHDSWTMAIDGEKHGEPVDWHESYNFLIREKKSYFNSRLSQGDLFYRFFLSDSCLGKACYKDCKYKYISSAADIRFGDLWGSTYAKNEDGVSGVLVFTDKGRAIIEQLRNRCIFIEHNIDTVCEGQMRNNPPTPMVLRNIVIKLLQTDISLKTIYYSFAYPYNLYIRAKHKMKRILKK